MFKTKPNFYLSFFTQSTTMYPNKQRISSLDSTTGSISSAYSNNQFTFNNLPSFTNSTTSKRSNNIQSEASFLNTSTSDIPNKVELPFVPSKKYHISKSLFKESNNKLQDNEQVNKLYSNMNKNNLFGHRVWSTERPRQFTPTKIDLDLDNDYDFELLKLIKNFFSLLYLISSKFSIWLIWVLNLLFHKIKSKVNTIPNPKWEDQMVDNEAVAESTPVSNKIKDIKVEPHPINPLFQKKLHSINNAKLNDTSEAVKEIIENGHDGYDDDDDDDDRIIISKTKKQYGTYFFNKPKTPSKLNLETCFFRTATSEKPINLYKKSSDIRNNMLKIHSSNTPTVKPTFTRSTNRFKDLEWLVDYEEDYLNNLESTRLFKEYQKIIEERKKIQQLLNLTKLKEKGLGIKPLTPDQLIEVEEIWVNQPPGTLINKFRVQITSRDLQTLSDRHWLNDNVIDFYLQLIKEFINKTTNSQIHVFSTFFYTTLREKGYQGVRKWAKRAKIDVSKQDLIIIPINLNQTHWALSIIDNRLQKFQYFDSLSGDGTPILYDLQNYMISESGDSKRFEMYDLIGISECPNQQNGFDCGVFACTAADYLARGKDLEYSQADMPHLRRRMCWEILHGELLDH